MLKKLGLVSIATAFVLSTALFAKEDKGAKNSGERNGETVFSESCAVCHANKTIPETLHFGDPKDWKDLIEEGQQFPSAHGWVGTRKMPRHGGDPKITLSEFISAVAYMAKAQDNLTRYKVLKRYDNTDEKQVCNPFKNFRSKI